VEVKTPYQGMRELLDDARYDAVRAAIRAAEAGAESATADSA
jgi:hypothetical protein